jgi:phage shock protein PspC (stress-responsive transcriptional regulator)
MLKRLQHFVENQAFGVCTKLGEILGISSSIVRMYFIYASFLTLGSPIIVYLSLAFWMNVKRYLRGETRAKELT